MAPEQVDRLRAIIETQTDIARTRLDLDAVMDLVVRRAQELTKATAGVMELVEGDEMVYSVVSGAAAPYRGTRLDAAATFTGLCVAEDRPLYSEDTATDARVDREACRRVGAGSMICTPLRHDGAVVGVLKVYAEEPRAFSDDDLDTLGLLAGIAAAHMAHASQFEATEHDSLHDALTGLRNRRAYDERLLIEAARARRYRHPLSLCLLDLDGFKAVNDRLGHPAGDAVLEGMGRILADTRLADECFRIGGDEFAILMPETTRRRAEIAVQRVLNGIADARLGDGEISASVGIAVTLGDPLELHAEAAAALGQAKRARSQTPR
jgi:diguanylate cyclase (GGDEF)-like protein